MLTTHAEFYYGLAIPDKPGSFKSSHHIGIGVPAIVPRDNFSMTNSHRSSSYRSKRQIWRLISAKPAAAWSVADRTVYRTCGWYSFG